AQANQTNDAAHGLDEQLCIAVLNIGAGSQENGSGKNDDGCAECFHDFLSVMYQANAGLTCFLVHEGIKARFPGFARFLQRVSGLDMTRPGLYPPPSGTE